jgi:hypothetical protein
MVWPLGIKDFNLGEFKLPMRYTQILPLGVRRYGQQNASTLSSFSSWIDDGKAWDLRLVELVPDIR